MNENYTSVNKSKMEKNQVESRELTIICNSDPQKKPSGKQILNKLKENVKKNNLNSSFDGADVTKITEEDKNNVNLSTNKTSKMTSPNENNDKAKIPDVRDSIYKSTPMGNDGNSEKIIILQNKTSQIYVDNLSDKKRKGCLQFIFKCFSAK